MTEEFGLRKYKYVDYPGCEHPGCDESGVYVVIPEQKSFCGKHMKEFLATEKRAAYD